jgi:recyclin-1
VTIFFVQQSTVAAPSDPTEFLSSNNPAQIKRNVLTSFTNVLLLPVTIVPRTVGAVGAALTTSGNVAVQGIAMLNPQRWGGSSNQNGYSSNLGRNGQMLFEHDDEDEFEVKEKQVKQIVQREHRYPFSASCSILIMCERSF